MWKRLGQGKIECGGAGIFYILFLAPKRKHCPAIIEQKLSRKNVQSVWRCCQSNDENFFENAKQ